MLYCCCCRPSKAAINECHNVAAKQNVPQSDVGVLQGRSAAKNVMLHQQKNMNFRLFPYKYNTTLRRNAQKAQNSWLSVALTSAPQTDCNL